MQLTKQFTMEQYAQTLDSWLWLDGLDRLTPSFTSLFGDVFLTAADGAWWFLDTMGGTLTREWPDRDALVAALDTEEGQDRYLLGGLAFGAGLRRGLPLPDDHVYAWTPPPMITGSFDVDAITTFPFIVAVHVAGQIHAQS
jgi:hypothetical protein